MVILVMFCEDMVMRYRGMLIEIRIEMLKIGMMNIGIVIFVFCYVERLKVFVIMVNFRL